jgi:predicted SAM-dependent methyltransferase
LIGLLVRPYLVANYLRHHDVRKLQIGASFCILPDWLNTDLYPMALGAAVLDATRRFPFPDASFNYIFSEHQLEHIPCEGALCMLRECRRILRPGGKIRIAVPSLDRLIQLFVPHRSETQESYISTVTPIHYPHAYQPNPCFAINSAFMNWGHKFLYDQETLCKVLQMTGFSNMKLFSPGQSDDANLIGIETRTSERDLYETMVIEAERQ